jgi:hypothetical protein
MSTCRALLRLGAYANFAIALAHSGLFLGMLLAMDQLNGLMGALGGSVSEPSGGRWGWVRLLLAIIAIVAFVGLLGLYGLSGAQRIRRLPFLRTGLVFAASLYLAMLVFHLPEVLATITATLADGRLRPLPTLVLLCALTIGLSYLGGAIGLWGALAPGKQGATASTRA